MLATRIRRTIVAVSTLALLATGGLIGAPLANAADVQFTTNTANQSPGPLSVSGAGTLLVGISLDGAPAGTTFSLPVTTGLTASYGYSLSGALTEVTFTGTAVDTNAALAAMLISTGSATGFFTINVTASQNAANLYYFPELNHYYEYVPGLTTWTSAKTAAEQRTLYGATGYLVTITSATENDFIKSKVNAPNIWIGANDAAVEGEWRWMTGPEAGIQFWQGASAAQGGVTTAPFFYAAWNPVEPNNAGAEDYAVTNWRGTLGQWNDVADNSTFNNGYLTEYSGPFTGVSSTVRTAEVVAPPPPAPQYTLNFDANGGSCTAPSQTGPATSWVSTPGVSACSRSGYIFTGWNTSPNGSGVSLAPGASTQLSGDNTLYAQWISNTAIAVNDTNETTVNTPVSGSVAPNDTAPPGSTFTLFTRPVHGSVVMNTDGSYTYTPNAGFTGIDSFVYQLCAPGSSPSGAGGTGGTGGTGGDGLTPSSGNGGSTGNGGSGGRRLRDNAPRAAATCPTATVTITVTGSEPATNPPVVTPPGEKQSGSVAEPGSVPPGTVYSIVKQPADGTVVMEPNGSYVYTPNTGFTGKDSFTYQVCVPGATVCPQFVQPITVGKGRVSGSRCGKDSYVSIGFAPLSSSLTKAARSDLDRLRARNCRMVITGYVQPVGTTSNDLSLSKARATEVADYVRARNETAQFIVTAAKREIEPSCSRFDNRCVVVTLRPTS